MTWAKKGTKKKSVGVTKHGKVGVHGRGRHGSPLPPAAKADAWKHKFQARKQG